MFVSLGAPAPLIVLNCSDVLHSAFALSWKNTQRTLDGQHSLPAGKLRTLSN